jgi:hypothetical protein
MFGDILCTPTGGILLYHKTRKGQRGTSTERTLLNETPHYAHRDIAELLGSFDVARTKLPVGKIIDKRWAISMRKSVTNNTADTLTTWLHLALRAIHK